MESVQKSVERTTLTSLLWMHNFQPAGCIFVKGERQPSRSVPHSPRFIVSPRSMFVTTESGLTDICHCQALSPMPWLILSQSDLGRHFSSLSVLCTRAPQMPDPFPLAVFLGVPLLSLPDMEPGDSSCSASPAARGFTPALYLQAAMGGCPFLPCLVTATWVPSSREPQVSGVCHGLCHPSFCGFHGRGIHDSLGFDSLSSFHC